MPFKNSNSNNNNQDKKGDKNKKGDNTKSENKDDNAASSTGVSIGDAALDKDKTVDPSDSLSIGVHTSDITNIVVQSPWCVQDILASHPFNDQIWDQTKI